MIETEYDPAVAPAGAGVYDLGDVQRVDVEFPSEGWRLAAHLYLPPGQGPGSPPAPAVVLDGPAPSVKELVVPVYAIRLARAGYVTLTFDRRGWGGSDGPVRQHMDPPAGVRDIRNATTYLLSRPEVDAERVAAVGVCTGAGFVLAAGAVDRRYRAVACVAGYYGARRHLCDDLGHDGWVAVVRAAAAGRLADLRAGRRLTAQALRRAGDPEDAGGAPIDEAYDYYIARSAQLAPSWRNEMTLESGQNLLEFDAVPDAALVAPTPLLVVHGTVDPHTPPRYAQEVHDTATGPKALHWVETTNHVQLYDIEPYVGQAIGTLIGWLDTSLAHDGAG